MLTFSEFIESQKSPTVALEKEDSEIVSSAISMLRSKREKEISKQYKLGVYKFVGIFQFIPFCITYLLMVNYGDFQYDGTEPTLIRCLVSFTLALLLSWVTFVISYLLNNGRASLFKTTKKIDEYETDLRFYESILN